jgi:hypothetical protein
MRYIVVLAAICGFCVFSRADAAPFDELAERLEQFDEQDVPRQRTAAREQFDNQDMPRRARSREQSYGPQPPRQTRTGDRFASHPEPVAEPVTPQPVPEPHEFDHGGPWDDFGDGFFDGCCDDWCDWAGCRCRQFWGRAEYLGWWVRGSNTPALVTTSPDETPVGIAGVLPGASVLFGDQRINGNGRSGGRFMLGYWFDCCDTVGLETTFLFLGNANDSYTNNSSGSPILARPFFNVDTNQQDAILLAFPDIVVGNVNITSSSRVYGSEVNIRRALFFDGCRRLDVLAGYRFFQLNENLRIATNTTSIDQEGTVPVGTTFDLFDSFQTRSQFNGGQLGFNAQYFGGCWNLDLLFKLAIGGVTQTANIDGQTVVTAPGTASVTNTGGILAQNTNIGHFRRTQFSVLPEFGVNLHRQLTPCWRATLGYTVLCVTNVVRPGDQIDTQLDPNQFPPPATAGPFTFPTFAFRDSDVWLQGINVGIEYNF